MRYVQFLFTLIEFIPSSSPFYTGLYTFDVEECFVGFTKAPVRCFCVYRKHARKRG